jgi:hypothetical protein
MKSRWIVLALAACGVLVGERAARAALDICGCVNNPSSLGALDTAARTGFPPGTVDTFRFITVPLPADGVFVFDSVNIAARPEEGCCLTVAFTRNAANTPVTILVKGNVTIAGSNVVVMNGDNAVGGSFGGAGTGGLGGPGGFRGGDGAYQQTNGASDGGAGLGPSGGAPGLAAGQSRGGDATFFGLKELLPLVGGSGGGGGASFANQLNCAAGGGGGGGGAILIAANGTIRVDGSIVADGGNVAGPSNGACATSGGAGSGGAIRLVANVIGGTGILGARGGFVDCCTRTGGPGVIRLEAATNTFPAANTDPPASRASAPGPIVNPFTPTVTVTAVGGQAVPPVPQGNLGGVDVFVPSPGPTEIGVATSGVPGGTTLQVSVKPRIGGAPLLVSSTLSNCDGAGNCIAFVTPTLASGAYVVEARATFQTP